MHGPAPTVNCSRSATAASSELAPSGIRCPSGPERLMPAPSTGSMRAIARARRVGSSSGPSSPVSVTEVSASSNRPAMLMNRFFPRYTPAKRNGGTRHHCRVTRTDDGLLVLPWGAGALLVGAAGLDAAPAVGAALERDPLPGRVALVPAARPVRVLPARARAAPDPARLRRLPRTPPADD